MINELRTPLIVNSFESMLELGAKISKGFSAGPKILFLYGNLGAGKTSFTKGFAKGLEIPEVVTSPTFSYLNEYPSAKGSLYHWDLYRADADTVWEISGEGQLFEKGFHLIEWPEKLGDLEILPDFSLTFEHITENERQVSSKH